MFSREEVLEEFAGFDEHAFSDVHDLGGFTFFDRDASAEAARERSRRRRRTQGDEVRAAQREYWARIKADPVLREKERLYRRAYQKAHAQRYRDANRRFLAKIKQDPVRYAAYLERRREVKRASDAKNVKRKREYDRRWKAAHPERVREYKRRARVNRAEEKA